MEQENKISIIQQLTKAIAAEKTARRRFHEQLNIDAKASQDAWNTCGQLLIQIDQFKQVLCPNLHKQANDCWNNWKGSLPTSSREEYLESQRTRALWHVANDALNKQVVMCMVTN